MKQNSIAVIVLNYNGKQHLKEYFDSLLSQSLAPDEMILMDNGSTDGSVEFVENNYPQITIIEYRKKNLGTTGSSNYAFRFTKSEYVIFQSNDIRLDKDCVKELLKAIKTYPNAGIVSSVLVKYIKDEKTGKYHVDNAGGIMDQYGMGMQKYPDVPFTQIPEKGEVFFSYGGSFIIKRDLYKKVHGYDDIYFTLNDDIDLSWRVRLKGYRIFYTKKSFVYHKVSATLGILYDRPKKRFWSERNILRTLIKNYSSSDFFTRFPVYLVLTFGQIGYLLYRRKWSLAWVNILAILWNIVYLPDTLLKRSQIGNRYTHTIEKQLIAKSLKLELFHAFSKAI